MYDVFVGVKVEQASGHALRYFHPCWPIDGCVRPTSCNKMEQFIGWSFNFQWQNQNYNINYLRQRIVNAYEDG